MKDSEFQDMLRDYLEEMQDPELRAVRDLRLACSPPRHGAVCVHVSVWQGASLARGGRSRATLSAFHACSRAWEAAGGGARGCGTARVRGIVRGPRAGFFQAAVTVTDIACSSPREHDALDAGDGGGGVYDRPKAAQPLWCPTITRYGSSPIGTRPLASVYRFFGTREAWCSPRQALQTKRGTRYPRQNTHSSK